MHRGKEHDPRKHTHDCQDIQRDGQDGQPARTAGIMQPPPGHGEHGEKHHQTEKARKRAAGKEILPRQAEELLIKQGQNDIAQKDKEHKPPELRPGGAS